jgi:plasmid stabilization system protein ParE
LAQIIYAQRALADLDRLVEFLIEAQPVAALGTVELILEAVGILANHPLVGRSAERELRELVISRGRSGYIALYSYEAAHDTVLILALRHQREAGFSLDFEE